MAARAAASRIVGETSLFNRSAKAVIDASSSNRSRPVEEFRGWLLVEAGFDGGAEPLVDGPILQAAGF